MAFSQEYSAKNYAESTQKGVQQFYCEKEKKGVGLGGCQRGESLGFMYMTAGRERKKRGREIERGRAWGKKQMRSVKEKESEEGG